MMSEEEYRQEWLKGLYHTDYNNCRFAEDKVQYAKDWIKDKLPTVDLDNPKNIVDRINYCKLFDTNPDKALWCNKIWAYRKIKEIYPELAIEPAYIFETDKFTQEMFDSIPDGKWIFKCNHGSGWNLKFDKKEGVSAQFLIDKLNEWLSLDYSFLSGWEWQYHGMPRGIIVQPDLGDLLDWSFWCEDGKIEGVQISKKLGKNLEFFYCWCNEFGEQSDYYIGITPMLRKLPESKKIILEKIKPYALDLAKGFKFVRADFYCVNGFPKFGEMTFSPCSGKLIISKV